MKLARLYVSSGAFADDGSPGMATTVSTPIELEAWSWAPLWYPLSYNAVKLFDLRIDLARATMLAKALRSFWLVTL